ncbi:MAG: GTP-binding protein [Anaerolineae bacterium]
MKAYKILVTGTFNAGKTAFVRSASDIDIVTTERRITEPETAQVKEQTTVAMDYGQTLMGEVLLHLYGTPGQDRFEFMWQILTVDADVLLVLIDSEDRGSLMKALQIQRLLRKQVSAPYIVVANKQDSRHALSLDEIRRLLKLPKEVPVIPCVAHDRESVREVLRRTLDVL